MTLQSESSPTRSSTKKCDPIDVAAGIAALHEHGYDSKLTDMVIEHALVLWSRGEEIKAEKKALDAGFNGIDITTWKMVLDSAIAAAVKKQQDAADEALQSVQQQVEEHPEPIVVSTETPDLADDSPLFKAALAASSIGSIDEQEPDQPEIDLPEDFDPTPISQLYASAQAVQKTPEPKVQPTSPARPAGPPPADIQPHLSQAWEDVEPIQITRASMRAERDAATKADPRLGLATKQPATAADVIALVLEHHRSDQRRDCGAQTQSLPCDWSQGRSSHVYHCTLDPGHNGPHKDALHCWSFESFTDDQVVRHAPRNLAGCVGCKQAGIPRPYPCPFHEEVVEIAKHLRIDVP